MHPFQESLQNSDSHIFQLIQNELHRQQDQIELIASENIVSKAVLEAQGSILTNKYAEGYPEKRYYGGCEMVDKIEQLAIDRLCELFGCRFANVQPHSGSQANQAVFLAFLNPGDTYLGMSLNAGGHLTHGSKVNMSGKWFNPVSYAVDPKTYLIDYEEVRSVAHQEKPKLIIAGGSAYPRIIDFAKFREIADEVNAILMVDMAHFSGLVAGGVHPSPLPHAHVVTSTTHKTLRGPRGGIILSNHEDVAKKINSAIFPGLQGGPLEHIIAAKAVAFGESLRPAFAHYAHQVVKNAKMMSETLESRGLNIITGGTDTHLLLVDLRSLGEISGADAEASLERAGLTCNKNGIPFDPLPPSKTSGIRLGSPAGTTRGFKEAEFKDIANWIADILQSLSNSPDGDPVVESQIRERTRQLCTRFPIY
ncbi:Serine hydroxymethyltransferase [Candidatus Bealeia paramacronuclearis]|uniref:Serine hydroxymethyltransferase n=1 Tax=Candidatus Bealeia paramacronuclearis TaxID=1921001 RepID=A0ABZ2C5J1_9PROT|nr:Serine hydroxymethyltransferase [Candidatus Bealeia paramacronuclearis]